MHLRVFVARVRDGRLILDTPIGATSATEEGQVVELVMLDELLMNGVFSAKDRRMALKRELARSISEHARGHLIDVADVVAQLRRDARKASK